MSSIKHTLAEKLRRQSQLLENEFSGRNGSCEQYLHLILDNASDVLILGTVNGRRLYVSQAVERVLGFTPTEAMSQDIVDMVHPEDSRVMAVIWKNMLEDRTSRSVQRIRYRHKNGHYVWVESSVDLVFGIVDDEPMGYIAALRDMTQTDEAEVRAAYLAMHDSLTGLPNRALFREHLSQAISAYDDDAQSRCLLTCDLDGFKAVNDTLGHAAGDHVLRIVAHRMASAIGEDDMIARVGGDEFSILSGPLASSSQAHDIGTRLISAVCQPVSIEGRFVKIGLSVGFQMLNSPSINLSDIINMADIALYQAKAGGRNMCLQYNSDTGSKISQYRQLKLDIEEAINQQRFFLVYQPVIDTTSGNVVTCEALVRWNHPEFGLVSPEVFIPLAEQTGLIIKLGEWIIREACRVACEWSGHVRVAVNISAVQVTDKNLKSTVIKALEETGLSPSRLKLEVTESVFVTDCEWAQCCLRELQDEGVQIALDDFGTGYASITYLRQFSFDRIKLDKSFLRDISEPRTGAVIKGVVDICNSLNIGVVAEGVETIGQLNAIKNLGCELVQGFYFSRPISSEKIKKFILLNNRC